MHSKSTYDRALSSRHVKIDYRIIIFEINYGNYYSVDDLSRGVQLLSEVIFKY